MSFAAPQRSSRRTIPSCVESAGLEAEAWIHYPSALIVLAQNQSACMHGWMDGWMDGWICVCVCLYVRTYVCMCVGMYSGIHVFTCSCIFAFMFSSMHAMYACNVCTVM